MLERASRHGQPLAYFQSAGCKSSLGDCGERFQSRLIKRRLAYEVRKYI